MGVNAVLSLFEVFRCSVFCEKKTIQGAYLSLKISWDHRATSTVALKLEKKHFSLPTR